VFKVSDNFIIRINSFNYWHFFFNIELNISQELLSFIYIAYASESLGATFSQFIPKYYDLEREFLNINYTQDDKDIGKYLAIR
jgi:hypothetical protein